MYKNTGFMLIELLVVVLIIGILSAVALPQYQKAVVKSRAVQLQTAGKSLKEAVEAYYLANGEYPLRWDSLDIGFSDCREDARDKYYLWCPSFAADLYYYSDVNIVLYDVHGASVRGNQLTEPELMSLPHATRLTFWLDHSAHPGKTECSSDLTGLCKGLGY